MNGNKRFVTDGNLVTTENIYDELNRPVSTSITVNGVKETTSFDYDANSNKISETDWRGNLTQYVYDPLNRLSKKIDAYTKTIETLTYFDNGAQSTSADALGNVTQYSYDKNKRLIKTIDPETHTTLQSYDAVGNIDSKTDGDTNKTTYTYDEYNNLISVKNAKGEVTGYTYDPNKNMITQTDGRLNTSIFEYNKANKMTKRIDNGGRTGTSPNYVYNAAKTESYTYYGDGSMKTKTDRNGVVTTYTYDIHGRLLTETVGAITISYTYDGNGNQLTITDATGTTTRTYDELNRVTSKTVPSIGKSTYTYDIITGMAAGTWGESTIDPKSNVNAKVYDKVGRLVSVTADGKTTTYSYIDNGNRQNVVYPDGSKEVYTYYKDNLVKTLQNIKADGTTIIDSYSYTYDGAHNMKTKVDGKGTTSYLYDVLNRLQKVTEPSGKVTTYTYDAAGNRAGETVVLGATTTVNTYTVNDQNRLTNVSTKVNGTATQSTDYGYDNNGNQLTTKVNGTVTVTNTYDVLNQLITTVAGTTTVTNGYNGEGLRTSKNVNGSVTRYLYEADKVVLEVDGSGTQTAKNVYGTNLLTRTSGSDTLYYMYNAHADVTALIDANKVIRATYYYDAFGNPLETKFYDASGNLTANGVNNPITYAGYQYDKETGLYYLDSRMYDPKIASFLQEDSYRGDHTDPLSLNYYAYCAGNPLMYSDPSGHFGEGIWNGAKNLASAVGNATNAIVTTVDNAVNVATGAIDNKLNQASSYINNNVDYGFNVLENTTGISTKNLKYAFVKDQIKQSVGGSEGVIKGSVGMVTGTIGLVVKNNSVMQSLRTANSRLDVINNPEKYINQAQQIGNAISYAVNNKQQTLDNIGGGLSNAGKSIYNYGYQTATDPYKRGNLIGEGAVFVASMFVGGGEANIASKIGEAEKIEETLSITGKSQRWLDAEAKIATAAIGEESGPVIELWGDEADHYGDIAKLRQKAGLPEYKYRPGSTGTVTKAYLPDLGNSYYGMNSTMAKNGLRTSIAPSSNPIEYRRTLYNILREKDIFANDPKIKHLGNAEFLNHAEANALKRAFERQGSLGRVELYVDRPTCPNCQKYLGSLVDEYGITELKVFNQGNSEPIMILTK